MKRFLFFSLLIFPISLFAEGGLPDKPYIYVIGKAEIQKAPDIVTLKFELVGRAPDQSKANDEVQSKAQKIFGLLKERKIAENDVIAEDLRSEPEFEQEEGYSRGRGKLVGYKVTRPFEIKIRDIGALPKLADELIRIEGAEFSGIEGSLAKEKEVQEELRGKALADARMKAETSIKSIGMKIDAVFAVAPISPVEIEHNIFGEITRLGVRGAELAERTAPSPEYRLAPVTINQEAHVIYLISPAK
jgi:uncharacterized protein YggE